jgi:dTDP-4-amino-4,6-dideoxygalactose transaminase
MDWSSLESRITPKTKAILSVDWAGIPVDYRMIGEIAKENGLIFISDAAHSFGAEHEGVPVGHESLADYHAFSFQAIKLITTVDGGALSMSDDDAFRRGKLLRWFGVDRENTTEFRGELDVEEWGYKFHMNDLNAAIGLAQLPTMNASLAANAAVARMYDDGLDMKFYRSKRHIPYKYKAAHWLYTILLPEMGQQKQFTHYMKDKGIEVSQVHWRNDRLTTFKDFRSTNLKGVDYYADRMICLPIHSNLTLAEVDQVISAANDFVR